ncbi:hypothetical protein BKA69DRAFT_1123550 [Paraphysoderma sedebokerense]|nr:hypothetical protein BKA69DRAFT_1123550 [Paraphysoderma sedebokerense]
MHLSLAVLTFVAIVANSMTEASPTPKIRFGKAVAIGAGTGIVAGGAGRALGLGNHAAWRQTAARLDFKVPTANTEWKCGETAQVKVNSMGFGSFWGISNAKLRLMDSNYNQVQEVMNKPLNDFIKEERTLGIGRARNGYGEHSFTVPKVQSGVYSIQFESSNGLNMHASRIKADSAQFRITCNN